MNNDLLFYSGFRIPLFVATIFLKLVFIADFFISQKPSTAIPILRMLKTICSFQVSCCKMPPQEQGMLGENVMTKAK